TVCRSSPSAINSLRNIWAAEANRSALTRFTVQPSKFRRAKTSSPVSEQLCRPSKNRSNRRPINAAASTQGAAFLGGHERMRDSALIERTEIDPPSGRSPLDDVVVVIPALDEEAGMATTLAALPRVGGVIVVDNGSKDRT